MDAPENDPNAPIETWRGTTGPLLAVAIHAGHAVRDELQERFALDDAGRLREEDPFTERFLDLADRGAEVHISRFETDLNRPREIAVYRTPAEAWGLQVWKAPLPADVLERSLARYDAFYARLHAEIEAALGAFGEVVLLDLHSYNHRRAGPGAPPADPEINPVVNVGTAAADEGRWRPVIHDFLGALIDGYPRPHLLDVRENIKFGGGHLSRWVADAFGAQVLTLSIEFKKTYMDEWTGQPDEDEIQALHEALAHACTTLPRPAARIGHTRSASRP